MAMRQMYLPGDTPMTEENDGIKLRDPHSDSNICSLVKRTEVIKLATMPTNGKLTIKFVKYGNDMRTFVSDGARSFLLLAIAFPYLLNKPLVVVMNRKGKKDVRVA